MSHLFLFWQEMLAAVNRKEPFQFDHRVIATPAEANPAQNADTDRASLNRNIKFSEIHDVFLDRTVSPVRTTDESLCTAFRLVAWSPSGLLSDRKCILATVTADHRVSIYRNGRWTWEELDQVSARWLNYLRQTNWATLADSEIVEPGHSAVFTSHKSRAYLVGTVALAWSSLFTTGPSSGKKWAWLVTLQRSGHAVVWNVSAPSGQLALAASFDLKLSDPSAIRIAPGSSGKDCLLVVGSHRGIVKCWTLSWTEDDQGLPNVPECCLLGAILSEEDSMSVGAIEVLSAGKFRVIAVAKNSAVGAVSVKLDANGLTVIETRYVVLPGLQLTGWMNLSERNRILCATEDYQIQEIDMDVGGLGYFCHRGASLPVHKATFPANPSMLCRGVAGPPDGKTLFVLESVKVAYDHLKCREPTSLVVYVAGDIHTVMDDLKAAERMDQSLLALETYKSMYGTNWETIWEIESEDPTSETDHKLQLLRWLALFKSYVCYSERRYDKDLQDDLKSHAERAELVLQLRHVQRRFERLLANHPEKGGAELDREELIEIRLACDFVASVKPADRGLTDQVASRFLLTNELDLLELCPVCGLGIPFERRDEGQCPASHQALRCRATFRTCFEDTRSCRWCGSHYHPHSGISMCILCGGPAF